MQDYERLWEEYKVSSAYKKMANEATDQEGVEQMRYNAYCSHVTTHLYSSMNGYSEKIEDEVYKVFGLEIIRQENGNLIRAINT